MTPVLTIAGSDCSSGAGLQADLKTFQYFQLHGLTAVTSIVSETPTQVRRIEPVSPAMVEDQVRLMLETFPLKVVKTGMLGSSTIVNMIADIFQQYPEILLVVDPVMVASTGDRLLPDDAVAAYQNDLLPLAYVITPNIPEAEVLLQRKIANISEMQTAAAELSEKFKAAILLKGGHLSGEICTDILYHNGIVEPFSSPRLKTFASHGTGCTLAAALASGLCLSMSLTDATSQAKSFLNRSLHTSYSFPGEIHLLNQGTI